MPADLRWAAYQWHGGTAGAPKAVPRPRCASCLSTPYGNANTSMGRTSHDDANTSMGRRSLPGFTPIGCAEARSAPGRPRHIPGTLPDVFAAPTLQRRNTRQDDANTSMVRRSLPGFTPIGCAEVRSAPGRPRHIPGTLPDVFAAPTLQRGDTGPASERKRPPSATPPCRRMKARADAFTGSALGNKKPLTRPRHNPC